MTKAGSRTDQTVCQIDLLATAADIVGAEVPMDGAEDSVSFFPVLNGTAVAPVRSSLVSQSIGGQFAIRDGDWKLCLCPGSGGWSEPRPGRHDLSQLPPMQLYDLSSDPGESRNLIDVHPDKAQRMQKMLSEIIDRGRSTPGQPLSNDAEIVMVKPIQTGRKAEEKVIGRRPTSG